MTSKPGLLKVIRAVLLRSRWLATTLVVAQLCAVAHLALVPHTAGASGNVVSSVAALENHLDELIHPGPHAHAPSPPVARGEEESCSVLGLLSSASSGRLTVVPLTLSEGEARVERVPTSSFAPDRRALLLAAPKASPPAV